jgi:hypothetical protein
MKLSELLSLDPGKSITEPPGAAGGDAGAEGIPGVPPPGGDMGGAPPPPPGDMGGAPPPPPGDEGMG